ncbi:LysE family translocator [Halioxenophilus sp. WMMB6]|uniref:LysE family translocator n=1 Tax=Halioxenophilus sp. WMMB6 TaxID=3073815 RepID=UPI00295E2B74|nr:LysE family translocator [Halioxenophilus sp. WMMB6]
MDAVYILSFMAIATLLVVSPGPNGLLIAKTVPSAGKAAGFANIAGFMVAFAVHGGLSILGISILLVQSAEAFFIFKLLGAAYLCWLGAKSLWSARQSRSLAHAEKPDEAQPLLAVEQTTAGRGHRSRWLLVAAVSEGFLTNVLNPKVSLFYLAAFPQFLPAGAHPSQAFLLVLLHALINFLWFTLLIFFIARLQRLAQQPALARWLKSITGAVFIGFGAKLASLQR